MKRTSSNWMVKITRVNADGSHDFINMIECPRIESAKRTAANYSREGLHATIYDIFAPAGCRAIYQYFNGRKVAEAAQ